MNFNFDKLDSSKDEIQERSNAVVLSFDVLGFKDMTTHNPVKASGVLSNIYKNLIISRNIFSENQKLKFFSDAQAFSDCVFLFCSEEHEIGKNLERLTILAARAIILGLISNDKYLVRCGIGFGNLTERKIWFSNQNRPKVFAGSSIISAHEMETSQNWMGGCVAPALDEYAANCRYLTKYQVPTKSEKQGSNYAINWPSFIQNFKLKNPKCISSNLIREIFMNTNTILSGKEKLKMQNTISFFEKFSG